MLAKVLNDFLTPIRKNCCRSSSCGSACRCCASANRHSVLSCRRSPTRPTIALHSCAWQKPSQHSLLACAALPKRLVSSNARESCDSWLKTFCWAKIPSPFVTAFRFLRVRPKTDDRRPHTLQNLCPTKINIPTVASGHRLLRLRHRLMRRTLRTKPVTVLGERRVPSASQNLHHRLLDKPGQHRPDAQLAHPSVRLGDFYS